MTLTRNPLSVANHRYVQTAIDAESEALRGTTSGHACAAFRSAAAMSKAERQ
jgi:hypothetical protein